MTLDDIDVFVFDFDGTLCDSNQTKHSALVEALIKLNFFNDKEKSISYADKFIYESGLSREYKLIRDFKKNFGISEVDKLIEVYSNNLKIAFSDEKLSLSCISALKKFKEKGHVYILSGGRFGEIIRILERSMNLDLIDGVFGGGVDKQIILNNLNSKYRVTFFGDSLIDLKAAINSGVEFINITGYTDFNLQTNKFKKMKSIGDYFVA